MIKKEQRKCKECGQLLGDNQEDYCGKTCLIAATKENPLYIRRQKTRHILLVVGGFYGLLLGFLDGNLLGYNAPFYISLGALIGYIVGIPLSWLTYYYNKKDADKKKKLHR